MNIIRKNIPNTLTCLNLLSGCIAIIFAFHPAEMFGQWAGWQWACLAIGIAAVADFSDGFMARLLHAYSDLGKELDSLSDLVSFGVAPAMLVLNIVGQNPSSPAWLPWCALFIPVCGALRLARFNIDTRQTDGFIGLPIPANAIFWIGWTALAMNGSMTWSLNTWLLLACIILEALAMVSNIPFISLKFHNYLWKGNERRWILLVASLLMITFWGLMAFWPVICVYFLISISQKSN